MAKRTAEYDPVTKRYHATCPHCGFKAVRAEAEAAEWVLANHVAYTHEDAS